MLTGPAREKEMEHQHIRAFSLANNLWCEKLRDGLLRLKQAAVIQQA
tara:strand:- start:209 stop:349 length:141 start_codon:yes stop_codon:yes gene_type:complete